MKTHQIFSKVSSLNVLCAHILSEAVKNLTKGILHLAFQADAEWESVDYNFKLMLK